MVSHVARPAMISVRTVEPRSEMWKYRSRGVVPVVLGEGGAHIAMRARPFRTGPRGAPWRWPQGRLRGRQPKNRGRSAGDARSRPGLCHAALPATLPKVGQDLFHEPLETA